VHDVKEGDGLIDSLLTLRFFFLFVGAQTFLPSATAASAVLLHRRLTSSSPPSQPPVVMSLFRQAAWRKHPLLQVSWSSALIGLPTGIAMFVAVKSAEAVGIIKWDAKSVNTSPASDRQTATRTSRVAQWATCAARAGVARSPPFFANPSSGGAGQEANIGRGSCAVPELVLVCGFVGFSCSL
jgi:hypothetical protein